MSEDDKKRAINEKNMMSCKNKTKLKLNNFFTQKHKNISADERKLCFSNEKPTMNGCFIEFFCQWQFGVNAIKPFQSLKVVSKVAC